MICPQCAIHLETEINRIDGVRANVSFENATADVECERLMVCREVLRRIRESGYNGTPVEQNPTVVDHSDSGRTHLAIIGSGSAAFAAALRAVEDGASVTLVEAGTLGGTCVNVGCVPSKIMIRAAQLVHQARGHHFDGLQTCSLSVDRRRLLTQQKNRIDSLRESKYSALLRSNPRITLLKGQARFLDGHTLHIVKDGGHSLKLEADKFLIATGARPAIPVIPGLADTPYWDSTMALESESIPGSLLVIGASVIALELAQAFQRLGSRVTLLARSTLLSKQDPAIGKTLVKILREEGIVIHLHTTVSQVAFANGRFRIGTDDRNFSADRLLVATGRSPNTDELGLARIGVKTDSGRHILVDQKMRTSAEHIFAAGDCSNQPQHVYVAAAAGTRAAINLMGGTAALDLAAMPSVVFTDPQVATVGLTEEQALRQGISVESRTLDVKNIPRAQVNFETRGFIKIVAEPGQGRIVGVQIVAAEAGEIIQTVAVAITNKMTVNELAGQLFPYLTMVEGLKLCAQTFTRDISQLSCCAGS